MKVKLGDLVAGYHMGKYFLGYVTRLNGVGVGPDKSRYRHAVTWIKHWNNAEYTPYINEELSTIEQLKLQFEQWKVMGFK